jgi:hypothetical protein
LQIITTNVVDILNNRGSIIRIEANQSKELIMYAMTEATKQALQDIDRNPLSEFAQEDFDAMKEDIKKSGYCNIGGNIGGIRWTVKDAIEECENDELKSLFNDAIQAIYLSCNPVSMEIQGVMAELNLIVDKIVNEGLKEKALEKEVMFK